MKTSLLLLLVGIAAVKAIDDHWALTQATTTCVLIESNATGKIMVDNAARGFDFNNSVVSGSCSSTLGDKHTNVLYVTFDPQNKTSPAPTDKQWNLTLTFLKYDEDKYNLTDWVLTTHNTTGYNISGGTFNRTATKSEFSATVGEGFKCTNLELPFEGGITIYLDNIKAVAFGQLDKDEFTGVKLDVCEKDKVKPKTSALVPIIVGCFLAGLVVAVIVAYMVGRYRARSHGYASV